MKILTQKRKENLRPDSVNPLNRAMVKAAIRLWRRHGDPERVLRYYDMVGFQYSWSFIGIELDGYTHS